jgi:hypothetical protein
VAKCSQILPGFLAIDSVLLRNLFAGMEILVWDDIGPERTGIVLDLLQSIVKL